jgi:hypothetical protein
MSFTKLFYHLDFNKNEARNLVISNLSAAPGTPAVGQVYWDTTLTRTRIWDGTAWGLRATDSDSLNGQNAAFYLSRANHTGTQNAASISDLATVVKAYRLDEFAAPTASVALGGQRITGLADPISAQDAATMGWTQVQVANAAAGIDSKPSVRVVANTNQALTGTPTIDGVATAAGNRILLTAQTTASQNGVYVAAAGAWARAVDADTTGEITAGATWFVEEGTTYGASTWRCATTGTITIGTTSITITQLAAAISYTASLGVQLVGADIRAAVVGGGGVQAVAGGLQIDNTLYARGFYTTFGNGSSPSAPINHNLNTTKVNVTLREVATNELVGGKVVVTDANNITITFSSNIANNGFSATIVAIA